MNDELQRDELRSQYRLAVDEYRFQVDLNWRRSEYFFVLNIGVLVAASTLLASDEVPRALVGLVFGLGALLAVLSVFANKTQGNYYREARDRKKLIEERLEMGDLALATTPGMGSSLARLGKVGTFLKTMLVLIAFVDLVGAGHAIADAIESDSPAKLEQISIRAPSASFLGSGQATVTVSKDGEALATRGGQQVRSCGQSDWTPVATEYGSREGRPARCP